MVDTPRPPRSTLALSDDAARRAQFSDRPPYQKPSYKPGGGGFRPAGGAGGPRKRPETSNPDLIRDFQCVQEKGKPVETIAIRQDSVGWLKQKFIDGREVTILGLRNAGAAPIPINEPFAQVNDWWRGAYPLTVRKP